MSQDRDLWLEVLQWMNRTYQQPKAEKQSLGKLVTSHFALAPLLKKLKVDLPAELNAIEKACQSLKTPVERGSLWWCCGLGMVDRGDYESGLICYRRCLVELVRVHGYVSHWNLALLYQMTGEPVMRDREVREWRRCCRHLMPGSKKAKCTLCMR